MTPPHAGLALPHHPTARLSLRLLPLALAALVSACATGPGLQTPATAPIAAAQVAAAQPAPLPVAAPAPAAAPALVDVVPQPATPDPIAVDPLRPTELLDLGAPGSQTDLWARVRQGTAIPDLQNERVEKWQQYYASRPDYVQRMTERGGRYLFHIVEEVNRRGLPTELALLPFIESAFNPQAMSSAKASGMWQFIPGTGRDFDLRQNVFRDDRRDVLASTRAALDYLQMLHGMFGDWQLALAAYNWGQGSVQRAIDRNQRAGLPTDYDSLRMPDETRNYLPKLQAVENIVANPQAFGLRLPVLQNHPYFVSVALDRDIDLDLAARLAGVPLDEFKQLNPQMNKPVILAAGTPQVLLPYDNASQFVRGLRQHRGNLASWTAWVAPKTVKPAEAARLVGMDEAQLRSVNNIPKGMLVKAGSTLLVPRSAHRTEDVAEHIADNAMLALAPDVPPLRRQTFKAGKKGDSVAAVAKRFRMRPEQVAQLNNVAVGARFKPGQAVTVMVASKPTRVAAKAGAAKRLSKPAATARTRAN
ncbi:transglycosylase SLT domain-containing protein [Pseudaquabacterium pictum]|uniref:transglycosylase SLT domain-containing protein n=1 Tax=Pseudaquabacterium pictum TaxID=2315236 RepID=UPI0010F9CAD6|nr:transglycosylase SLT domain-containing protein [Rubrivivax pictus]